MSGGRVACALLVAVVTVIAACDPSPSPSATGSLGLPTPPASSESPSAAPTTLPTPTIAAPESFPLAVVTGMTNRRWVISLDELATLAGKGQLVVPCGVEVT